MLFLLSFLAFGQTCEVIIKCNGQEVGTPTPLDVDSLVSDLNSGGYLNVDICATETDTAISDTGLVATGDTGVNNPLQIKRIVILLADDVGYGVLSSQTPYAHPNPIAPNLDSIAANGIRFTRAYASPNCSPARAALLTGRVGARDGVHTVAYPINTPAIDRSFVKAFQAAGWETFHAGKWHISGIQANPGIPVIIPERSPTAAGFNQWISTEGWMEGGESILATEGQQHPPASQSFVPWLAGTETGNFLELQGESSEVLLSLTTDFLVENPNQSLAIIGLGDAHTPYTAQLSRYDSAWSYMLAKEAPGYAAEIRALDSNLGAWVADMESLGMMDETLVFFISDNGAREWSGFQAYPNGDTFGYKKEVTEGGIRVPMLVFGAGLTPGVVETPVSIADFGATLAQLTGVAYAPLLPTDGESFAPAIQGVPWQRTKDIPIYGLDGDSALLSADGYYKVERTGGLTNLLNLGTDPRGDTLDTSNPGLLASMSADLDYHLASIADSANCLDYPGQDCGPVGPQNVKWWAHSAYTTPGYYPAWCPYFSNVNAAWNKCN